MKNVVIILAACTLSFFLMNSLAKSVQLNKQTSSTAILTKIRDIKNNSDEIGRVASAKDLADLISAMPEAKRRRLSNAEIDSIATLLFDCDDGVRMYAAIVLGNIGPRASRVLAQLRKSLEDNRLPAAGQIGPTLGSTSAIYKAIEKISTDAH